MSRARVGIGYFTSAFLVLSAFAHSVLGWSVVEGELAKTNVPADLSAGIGIAWRLGGAAMLVFAAIVATWTRQRARGVAASRVPVLAVGTGYLLYGAWAFVMSGFDPFFFVMFVLPGVLTLVAAQ